MRIASLTGRPSSSPGTPGHFGRDWVMFPNATCGSWRKTPMKAWDAPLL